MDLRNCWDCPVTLSSLGLTVVILTITALASAWLLRRRIALLQVVGAVVLSATSFFVLALPVHVPNWGVIRPGPKFETFAPDSVRIALIIFVVAYFVIGVIAVNTRGGRRAV